MNPDFSASLTRFVDDYVLENDFSGILRITVRGDILYEYCFGYSDREKETRICRDDLFTLYSVTKPFCTIGLMKLVDRGLVDLNSHPSRYVPEAVGFDERVTIHQMLHHTSGLPDFHLSEDFHYSAAPEDFDIRQGLKELSQCKSFFAPGMDAKYENINFNLAALIIENVSKTPYSEYMMREVLSPLGMKSAYIHQKSIPFGNRVKGYQRIDGKAVWRQNSAPWMFGAGDLVGSADDVYALNRAVKERLLLTNESWNEVLTPSPLNHMGMGCTITNWHGKQRITHNGGSIGFRNLHVYLPQDDFDIIFLSNCDWVNARKLFAETIHDLYYGKDHIVSEEIPMDVGYAK